MSCVADIRVESGSDDLDYLGHLGHFSVSQVDLICKLNYVFGCDPDIICSLENSITVGIW